MLSLARLVVALVVVFAAAAIAVHVVGGIQPMPVATLFTNPDGSACQKTCLLGIIPGQTTARDALLLLKTHPLTQHLTFFDTGFDIQSSTAYNVQPGEVAKVHIGKVRSGLVDFVEIDGAAQTKSFLSAQSLATLGEIMTVFGSPKTIETRDLQVGLAYFQFLRDPQLLVVESLAPPYSKDGVDPRDNITALVLIRWVKCAEYKDNLVDWSQTSWLGDASVARYGLTPIFQATHRRINSTTLPCVLCQP